MSGRRFGAFAVLFGFSVCAWHAAFPGRVDAQTVTLSGSVVGSTPTTLGYNIGHFHNNQTASWWQYSGVNGARMFTSPSTLTPTSLFKSSTTSSLNATTQAQFLSQRTALRNSGTAATYINWSGLYTNYTSKLAYSNNEVDAQFADATVKAAGGKSLIVMQRTPGTYAWPTNASDNSATDWQNRWLGWQQWYAQAFVRARYEDVENFQLFNEPDLYGSGLSQSQWIEMLKYGANAVESAIADVNRIYGKNLKPHVYGPVTNGPSLTTITGTDWGDLLLQNRDIPVLSGTAVNGYQLFDHFDYHNYGSNPTAFGTKLAGAIADVDTLTGGQGASYPVTISEFNTRTSSNYAPNDPVNNPSDFTPDSLEMSSRLGQIVVNLANNKPDELYLFKFTDAGGANNGVHWQSSTGNVGGATKSADVYRLFTEGFTGKDLLAAPTISGTVVSLAASRDAATGTRYLMAANADTNTSQTLTLDLTSWGVAAGTRVTVEQVSDRFSGNISQVIDVGSNRTITVNTDAGGVVLVRVPEQPAATKTVIPASQDAHVRQANSTTNYGTATSLLVQSGSGSGSRYVSYLQFPLTGVDGSKLTEATLGVYGWDPGATGDAAAGIICHVYGITSGSWSESSLKWSNAPNINNSSSYGTLTGLIDENYTTGIGTTAEIVGQITATGTEKLISLDVARWVKERIAAGATNVSFMITRDFRFDGDLDQAHSLTMRSSEYSSGAFAPTLTVTAVPEPATILLLVAGAGCGCRLPRRRNLCWLRRPRGGG